MSGLDLGTQSRNFAHDIQALLNQTVCDHAQVNAVINKRSGNAHIGTRLSRHDLLSSAVRLRSQARTKIWLDLSSVWFRNVEGHLTAQSSYCGIYLGEDPSDLLLHYDYEREKDLYTEAHVQVAGRHPGLEQMLRELGRDGDQMKHLHLPVGGRRLRPSLEDLLESLIAEKLIEGKPGHAQILDSSRRIYRQRQISAIVRSNPKTAAAALRAAGWTVEYKPEKGLLSTLRGRRR